jgi:hypothetical protein
METDKNYYFEFELQKIKNIDVFNEFSKIMDEKLQKANIKYDIRVVPGNNKMVGGASSFPYNKFENVMDSIVVRKKQDLQQERKGLLNQLFKKTEENNKIDTIDKKNSFFNFDIFNKQISSPKKDTDISINNDLKNIDSKPDVINHTIIDEKQISKNEENIEMVSQPKNNTKDYSENIEDDEEEINILNVILIIYRDHENDKILSTTLSIKKTLLAN